ncbi:NAD(+) diphosphatase [Marinobacter caseinilyticus]|uniref:NAD(+) diphosphatase n=1 Tax=Marinobacter caseinilyticus TaxID=2692195 RepID=UPI00140E5EDE|nr:NAD(+) diphosphatase [Marinobacter caseinilyticus]
MLEWVAGWSSEPPDEGDSVVILCCHSVLRPRTGWLFAWSDIRNLVTGDDEPVYVGRLEARPVYVVELKDEPIIDGCESVSLRDVFLNSDEATAAMVGTAIQVLQWWRDHRYCGRCGQPTTFHPAERARWCGGCGIPWYARLAPCVIVVIRRVDQILLAQSVKSKGRFYSLIAGFVEPGESAEQAVAREVLEETGLEVTNVRYHRSQPWPFPHQLMLGFSADYAGGDLVLQEDELLDAQWFRPGAFPAVPPQSTIAGHLIHLMEREILAEEANR